MYGRCSHRALERAKPPQRNDFFAMRTRHSIVLIESVLIESTLIEPVLSRSARWTRCSRTIHPAPSIFLRKPATDGAPEAAMSSLERHEARSIEGQPVYRYDAEGLGVAEEEGHGHDSCSHGATFDRHALNEDYSPAYRAGYLYRMRHPNRTWEQAEHDLSLRWDRLRGFSRFAWNDAMPAARAAWEHVGAADRMPEF
jgi:hypothetical protein